MKNKLIYTTASRQDLDAIWDYISLELQNPLAADRIVGHILDKVEQLIQFPQSGALVSSVASLDDALYPDERFLVCEKYLIFYRTFSTEIYIDRVLYGGRDYLRVLFGRAADTL